jgi:hypothetical protein
LTKKLTMTLCFRQTLVSFITVRNVLLLCSFLSYILLFSFNSPFNSPSATPFPKNFKQSMKVIYTRLFRVYAIVYYHHYLQLEQSGAVSHLNTSFKHFLFFVWEYDMVPEAEQDALKEIIQEIRLRHASTYPTATIPGSSGGGVVTSGGVRSSSKEFFNDK